MSHPHREPAKWTGIAHSHHGHRLVVLPKAHREVVDELARDVDEMRIGEVELAGEAVEMRTRGVRDVERER